MSLPYISPDILSQYQGHIAASGAPATTKRRVSSLKKFFEWAHKQGHTPQNPFVQAGPVTPTQTSPARVQPNKKKLRVFAAISGTLGMAILSFLLIARLRSSIPSRIAPAQEGVPNSRVQVGTPKPTSTGQSQALGQPTTTLSPWTLYSKLTFRDDSGDPIQTVQSITFSLFTDQESTTPLWTSTAQEVTPDSEGNVKTVIKNVPTNLFFENETLYLAANLPGGISGERIPVSTAASLGGSSTAIVGADGNLLLAGESPSITSETGNLLIEGKAVTIGTTTASDGDIEINPDGTGIVHFLFEGTGQDFLNVQAPNLTRGSLIYGIVANNSTGYDLLRLQNGSKASTRFAVDSRGNTTTTGQLALGGGILTAGVERLGLTGNLANITGYQQISGNFSITQGAGDTATITKKGSALNDILTLTLDERGKPSTGYSALTIKRYDGANEAYGLFVDEGNARFDGQLQLGRFASNPGSIGTGSLIFNTTDSTLYLWDGSSWVDLLASGSNAFSSITSGTNTTATMIVGSGASLSFSGTGTITASSLSCSDCLNFTEFSDSLTLDAGTNIALGSLTLSTSGTGALNFASTGQVTLAGNVDATNGLDVTVANLTVGGANFTVAPGTGDTTTAGDIAVNGGDLTTTAGTFNVANAATTLNVGSTNIARTINVGTGTDADTINIGTGGTTAEAITVGNGVSGSTVSLTSGTGTNSWSISSVGAATFGGHVTLSSDASEGLSGGGLTDCDASTTSKLLWDATTNKFSCGADQDSAGTITLQSAYGNDADGSDSIIALTADDDSIIVRNPSSAGTDSGYILSLDQLATGAVDGLRVSQAGTGVGASFTFSNAGTTADGITISNSAGTLTDAIDVSDATGITNAINIGPNDIVGTTADIDLTNFDVVGSSGNITTAGDIAVNGGDLTTTSGTFNVANAATTLNLGSTNIARAVNLGTGTDADTINIGTDGTGADTITIGNSVSGTTVAITSGTGSNSWSITGAGAATFGGHVTLSGDANEGLSGGGLSDCDTATTSKLLWDATTNKFSCGIDSDTGISTTTLQIAYGNDANGGNTIVALTTDDDSLIFRNPASGGTDSSYLLFLDQLAAGDVNTLELSNDGTGSEIAFTSTSPTLEIANTGTLTVTDGANILFSIADDTAEGDVTVTGDLAVNGATSADITTSTGAASVFNTNATTLNIGGAATTVSIGASTGTTTVNNDLAVTGGDINGPSGENIDLGEATADTITFYVGGSGELVINASALAPSADSGLDIGSSSSQFADLYLDGGNINLDNATDIDIDDNTGSALTISEGSNNYLAITTTNSSEVVSFGNTTTNPAYNFLGTGLTTLGGDLAINGGNITTAVTADSTLTVTGTLTANGAFDANGQVDLGDNGDTVSIDSSDWNITTTGDLSGIGSIGADGDLTITQTTPSIFLVDSTGSSDDYSINVDGNAFTIVNDTDGRTELTFAGNGGITIGSSAGTAITLATDSTGNAEVVLPDDAIGPNEVFTTGQTDEYCLTYESTGGTWEWQNCGAAASVSWSSLTDPIGDLTLSMAAYNTTFNWDPGADSAETSFLLTIQGEDTVGGGDEDQVLLALSQTSNGVDVDEAADALLTLTNSDSNDPVNDAIRFDAGGAGVDFLDGIDFSAANLNREIVFENGEALHGQTADTFTFEDDDGTDYATLSASSLAIAGDLAINGGNITTAVTADSTLTVTGTLTANGAFDANGLFTLGDDGETGAIDTSDWNITTTGDLSGIGSIGADGDLTITQTTPSIFLVDSTGSSDDYSINVDGNAFTIVNDSDGRTELTFAGDGSITLGSATATTINLTTDSTGNAEVVLPDDAIGPNEVFTTGQTDEYCLTYEATGSTWEWQSCSGGAVTWNSLSNPTGDLTLSMAAYNTTFNWDPGADSAETSFLLTIQGEDTVGGGDEDQVLLALSQTSNGVDVDEAADALLTLANNDANDPVGDAIRFDAGAAGVDFLDGIDFSAANLNREIVFENGEALHGQTADTFTFEDDDGTDYATLSVTALTLAGDLAINGGNITTAFTADSTVTVTGTLTANGAFDANGQVDLGDNGDTVTIDSSDWDINASGDLSGIGSIGADGDITITQATPTISLVDTGGDDYSINVDGNAFTIVNDSDGRTELTFAGDGSITLGSASATTINLTTDSTGDAEIVLPNSSIGPNEVFATGQTDEYCLTYEATGSTWEWQSCTAGITVPWNSITDPTGDLTLSMAAYNTTFNWDPGADNAETNLSLTIQGEDTVGGGDEDQVLLALSQTSNGVDVDEAADALLTLSNADANDPVNSAIRFDAGGAGVDFTYGINFDAASIGTAELIFQNAETIDNTVDGTLAITAPSTTLSGDLTVTGGDINGPSGENIDLGEATADTIIFYIGGSGELSLNTSALIPTTDSGLDLGSSANQFADLYLDGGNINLNGATDLDIDDNTASSFTISEGTNNYFVITTSNNTESVTLDLPAGGGTSLTGNLFTSSLGKTINIGTGTGADAINIGTGTTNADTLTFGNTGIGTTFNFNSGVTTGTALSLATPSLTTGEVLDITATSAPADGSTNEAIDINLTHTPTVSADNFSGINMTITDGTALGNTIYGYNNTLTLTGNAAKTGIGLYSNLTTSSTTADTLIGFDSGASTSGIITSGTRSLYGVRSQPASTALSTGGTTNVYGLYSKPGGVVNTGGTINAYGLYLANGTMDTAGTSRNIGAYFEPLSGADTNIAVCFDCDGTWSSSSVAAGIQFGTDANAVTLYRDGSDNLRTNDNVTIDLDLAVNGGDLTTTASTFNLLDTNATTINFGGAATTALNIGNGNSAYTAINIGSGAGGNTINLGTGTGADSINIGTGGTSADTVTVGNTAVATTVDINSGATTQNIVDISGTSLTSGNFLAMQSDANRTAFSFSDSDAAIAGQIDLSQISNITDIFVYDTTKDTDGGLWRNSENAKASSWYNETIDNIASSCVIDTNDRCGRREFPDKAILIVTTTKLYIFDAKDNTLWMDFRKGSGSSKLMIGPTTNSTGSSVWANDGKIYYGNNGSVGGLYVIDFKNDRWSYYDASNDYTGIFSISARNTGVSWIGGPSSPIINATINDVYATIINGKTFVVVGTDAGVSVINETDRSVYDYDDDISGTDDAYASVWIDKRGHLYALNKDAAQLEKWSNVVTDTADENPGNPNTRYDETTTPALAASTPTIAVAPSALYLVDDVSDINKGSPTIYVGHSLGLTKIDSYGNSESDGSVKYYTKDYITEEMIGDIRAMWPLEADNTAADLEDVSVKTNDLTATNIDSSDSVSGVRSTATDFNGTDENLAIAAASDADLDFNGSETFSLSAWIRVTTMPGTGEQDAIITKWDETNTLRGYRIILTNDDADTTGNLKVEVYDESADQTISASTGTDSILQNTWYHVVATFNGGITGTAGDLKIYTDGQYRAQNSVNASFTGLQDVASDFVIGDYDTNDAVAANTAFAGYIDEVMVTGETLTAGQVAHMRNVGFRALQNHTASRITGVTGADNYQRLMGNASGGTSDVSRVMAVGIDSGNQFIYAGVNDGTNNTGGVTVLGIDSDTAVDLYDATANTTKDDDAGTQFSANDVVALSVVGFPCIGYNTGTTACDKKATIAIAGTNDTATRAWMETSNSSLYSTLATLTSPTSVKNDVVVNNVFKIFNNYSTTVASTGETIETPALSVDSSGSLVYNYLGSATSAIAWDLNDTILTTGTLIDISQTALTTGQGINYTGPSSTGITGSALSLTSDIGSGGELINLAPDFSGAGVTGYGAYLSGTQSANAANVAVGYHGTLASSSTTADTLAVFDAATTTSGIITSGTRSVYGVRSQPNSTGASTGGTTNVYGIYSKADGTVAAGGTINAYGLYVGNGTMNSTGTSRNIGLYLEPVTSADTNIGICFDCDGTWTSSTVAAGIQFGTDANSVNLFRSASDVLTTNDAFSAGGVGQFGGTTTVAYNRFGTGTAGAATITTSADVMISSDLELDGIFYLDGNQIQNSEHTNTIVLSSDGANLAHALTNGAWTVTNSANTAGLAAFSVVQSQTGDILTGLDGVTTRFRVEEGGTTTITTTNAATVASLIVSDSSGTGAGKINVGTVDPIYTIGDGKYATYMAGMVGVKEEVTGNVQTDEYIPGIGYRKTIDFKTLAEGSDLWLFSRTTDLKDNIDKLVVLLSAEGNTRTWYRVDDENYILSIYSTKPTNISFRLTAPRFDYALWTNYNNDEGVTGFILTEEELNGNGELDDPSEDSIANYEVEEVETQEGFVYRLQDLAGNVINEFAKVSDFLAANITAGILRADSVVTENLKAGLATIDNLRINEELISPVIQTNTISPLADSSNVTVQIGNENIDSGFGELLIENAEGDEVASFDTEGNATISGTLEADSVKTNDVIAGKIYADEIVARNGYFGQIQTESAGGITREEIEQILAEVEESQGLLAQAATWSVNTATESGVIDEIAVENLFVTGLATINSLSVSETITAGSDLVISSFASQGGPTLNSINTLAAPLELQSLAMAPVEIMAGKVRIETNGDVYIDANLYVAGVVEAESLTATDATLEKITTDSLIIAGTEVATPSAVINGEIESNATVGQAVVPAGVSEITIRNPKITDYTLVYITPTSATENKTLYVKSKANGYFTVGFTDPISLDATFNWWVVEAQ